MGKEQNLQIELVIRRKGRTIYARLREDKEFAPAETAGGTAFIGRFSSIDQVRKELQDLMSAGRFKIVVPASSALAPERVQVVLFGDMTGRASAPSAPANTAPDLPVAPRPSRRPKPVLAAKITIPPPPAVSTRRKAAPAEKFDASPSPPPAVPASAPAAAQVASRPAQTESPGAKRSRQRHSTEEKAFKAFVNDWKVRNKIKRLPKEEMEELRQGEWQEAKDRFMAEWRKIQH